MYTVYTRILILLTAVVLFAACDSGSVPSDVGNASTVSFTASSADVSEDAGTVEIEVQVGDPGYKDPFEVTVTRTGGSVNETEIVLPSTNTLTFPRSATSGETRTYAFDIIDDFFPESAEDVQFELSVASGDVSVGDTGTFTVNIAASESDIATVPEARATAQGEPIQVTGIVTREDGRTVYLQDDDAGIATFDFGGNIADAVEPGDEVILEGEISEFNGLLQVGDAGDSFTVGRSGLEVSPVAVDVSTITSDGERYESRVVEVSGLTVSDTGTWKEETNYTVTDASGSMALRVQNGSPVAGEPIPDGEFTFVGVVGEFRGTYQLLPLQVSDIR